MIPDFNKVKDRIFEIEKGTWKYPTEELQEIVDMLGMMVFVRIRKDMGLPIKEKIFSIIT
jgi:hypothetical protein